MLNFPEVGAWYTQLQIDKQRQAASGSPLISANSPVAKDEIPGARNLSSMTNTEIISLVDLLLPEGYSPGYQIHSRFFSPNYSSRAIRVGRISGSDLIVKVTFLYEETNEQLITAFSLADSTAAAGNDYLVVPITKMGDPERYNILGLNFDFCSRVGVRQLYTHFKQELKMWDVASYSSRQQKNQQIADLKIFDGFSSYMLQEKTFASLS